MGDKNIVVWTISMEANEGNNIYAVSIILAISFLIPKIVPIFKVVSNDPIRINNGRTTMSTRTP